MLSDTDKAGMAPLQLSAKRLQMESAELQKAHDAAAERNRTLCRDNLNLKLAIRRLSPQLQEIDLKHEDLNKMRCALEKGTENLSRLQSQQKALETNNSDLKDELESRLGELSILRRIRVTDKEQIQNLSSCASTLEYQNALGQNCVQQKLEDIRQRDAALEELNSAMQERSEFVKEWNERETKLKVEVTEAIQSTQDIVTSFGTCQTWRFSKPQFPRKSTRQPSFLEELSLCQDRPPQETPPEASGIVLDKTPPKRRLSAHLKPLICTVGFTATLLFMLTIIGTAVPVCPPGQGVPCEDLLRDALQGALLPYCNLHFPLTPPY
ncbi:hypothetical protein AALO_G00245710 [Alosa alosa]|uniref:Uncharacterized protein n=1 Tax=Alosa alosa TaxID=278164 RepID=A0AAV6FVK4_9TELE|nr:uncharacterized protein LOC125284236 [Alosa alosa]KAG5265726.1 hypothetical protein AALO_G00245710 [Alosa alosa]